MNIIIQAIIITPAVIMLAVKEKERKREKKTHAVGEG